MTTSANQRITEAVISWPGVTAGTGRRGEWSFRVGKRELGHLHGDHAAHFSFPKQLWTQLVDGGRSPITRCSPVGLVWVRAGSRTMPMCAT